MSAAGSADVIRHVVIRGRVQGVGYRDFTERTALKFGLAGWVRNRRDGAVEAVFAGPADAVAAMMEACRRGPFNARVDGIDERAGAPDDLALSGGTRFAVLPTV
jgi:acylphosphatase